MHMYIYIYIYIWAHDVCGGPSWFLRESWCALRLLGFFLRPGVLAVPVDLGSATGGAGSAVQVFSVCSLRE